MTTSAAAPHIICRNRWRSQRPATTITIATAPLGTIDVGRCGNKFNNNLNNTAQHSGWKGSQLPLRNLEDTEINRNLDAATCDICKMDGDRGSWYNDLARHDIYFSDGELTFGSQFFIQILLPRTGNRNWPIIFKVAFSRFNYAFFILTSYTILL